MEDLYNLNKLKIIAAGDTAFIKKMLETFVGSCNESLSNIVAARKVNDIDMVGKIGHKLKPSIDTLAPWLSKDVREIEVISESQKLFIIDAFIKNLKLVVAEIESDLSNGSF